VESEEKLRERESGRAGERGSGSDSDGVNDVEKRRHPCIDFRAERGRRRRVSNFSFHSERGDDRALRARHKRRARKGL